MTEDLKRPSRPEGKSPEYKKVVAERLCVFCKHMDIDYDGGSNCDTCGYDASSSMRCGKGHWSFEHSQWSEMKDYRRKILTALTCKDYEQVKV